jgi:hypothetical protein
MRFGAETIIGIVLGLGCGASRPQIPPTTGDGGAPPAYCDRPAEPPTTSTAQTINPLPHADPQPDGPAADMAIADMNGDGRLDIVVSRGVPHAFGTLSVLYAGDGGWTEWVPQGSKHSYGDLEIGDVNRDGCLDIAAAVASPPGTGCTGGGVQLVLGERNGGRCELPKNLPSPLADPYSVIGIGLGDVDGDGWLDLALSRTRPDNCNSTGSYNVRVRQGVRHGSADGFNPTVETTTHLAAAFTAEVLDANADGKMDVIFGGKGARADGAAYSPAAFALLLLSTSSGFREVLLRMECGDHCDPAQLPYLFDLEVLPAKGSIARIATAHTTRHCPSDERCERRAAARVFELPGAIAEGIKEVTLSPTWSSEASGNEGGCAGPLATLEAASVGPAPRELDLLFGVPIGSQSTSEGDLVIVHGHNGNFGVASTREHHLRDAYHAFAMAVADLDGGDTHDAVMPPQAGQKRIIALPEPLHHVPDVRCGGEAASFTYGVESPYLSVTGCSGQIEVRYKREDAGDVVFAPKPADGDTSSPVAPPLHRLDLLDH